VVVQTRQQVLTVNILSYFKFKLLIFAFNRGKYVHVHIPYNGEKIEKKKLKMQLKIIKIFSQEDTVHSRIPTSMMESPMSMMTSKINSQFINEQIFKLKSFTVHSKIKCLPTEHHPFIASMERRFSTTTN
jgi:hydrogenase maturation factor